MMAEICDICLQVISEGDIEEHKQQCEVWVCSDCGMSLAFKDKDTHLEDHKISSVTCSRCGDKMESSDALKHEVNMWLSCKKVLMNHVLYTTGILFVSEHTLPVLRRRVCLC
eukprot:m.218055 g.218055  ORF g.218055 m.218055 type:complete len:112 (-) comp15898_c0_seq6:6258-6593(-)